VIRKALVSLVPLLCLLACASDPTLTAPPREPDPVDFSGHWELNYGQSDNIQSRLTTLVRDLQRRSARASNLRSERGGLVLGGSGTDSAPSVVGLARMAELITASQLLEVDQGRTRIRIDREGNFALSCDFLRDPGRIDDLGVGRESCRWDGQQLVFVISLPEGLSIRHRVALSGSGQQLGIVTTVFSDQVSAPFTVRRIYDRYEPGSRGYRCEETLSRGRVCTTEGGS
jgi:hypothetical protein